MKPEPNLEKLRKIKENIDKEVQVHYINEDRWLVKDVSIVFFAITTGLYHLAKVLEIILQD